MLQPRFIPDDQRDTFNLVYTARTSSPRTAHSTHIGEEVGVDGIHYTRSARWYLGVIKLKYSELSSRFYRVLRESSVWKTQTVILNDQFDVLTTAVPYARVHRGQTRGIVLGLAAQLSCRLSIPANK